jgi:hypothetical protein
MADLTTLAAFKVYFGIPSADTSRDTKISQLVTAASRAIERFCGRTFNSTPYADDRYNGDFQPTLQLRQYPVIVPPAVVLYDDPERAFTSDTVVDAEDYYVEAETGIIRLDGLLFSRGIGNVKVVYTAGYATIPEDLALICHEFIGWLMNKSKSDGQTQESYGEGSVSYTVTIPEYIKDKLIEDGWKKWEESF